MSFVHLKTFSEYSITKGINRIDELVKNVKNKNMPAIALTDENAMYGTIGFYKEARAKGIKPIIGINATIEQDDGNRYTLTLLAKNEAGYKKIVLLNSRAFTENRKLDGGLIKEEWLGELSDVIVLSGAKEGLIGKKILEGNMEEAKSIAQEMKNFFGDDFYMELQRDGKDNENEYMIGAATIASELNISPVATHPVLFANPEDFIAHEARFCIGSKEKLFDIRRERFFNKDMYLKSPEEMKELFSDIPEAIENTVEIAKKCNIELVLDKPQLPIFPTPNGENADDYFAQKSREGLEQRLIEDFPNPIDREAKRKEYQDRLETEIGIIKKMGFPGYFLIVSDFINWSKEKDIPVGPGRGSGAGSLVAYAMKITDLDPLPYGLLFERFLNPDRVSMPDFDIDFCQARRNETYEYVRQKYGTDAVCQIGTFGTMAAKAVIRDVGRTLDYNHDFVDTLAKMVSIRPNKPMTLKQFMFGDEEKGIEPDEKLLARYENEADVKKLIDIALKLEGITRQVGIHAAGVVIAAGKLTDYTPLYTSDEDSSPQTQFDMSDVEKAGLVKFDFLGLKTLTVIKEAIDLIHKQEIEENGKKSFDIRKIDINDQDVYKNIYANGNSVDIFQFESKGMQGVLKKTDPSKLEDLIAVNALYRPGPMDIIPEWLESRKLPEDRRTYPHPSLQGVLKETAGFMIYQEQVMQCAQIVAGYSLGGADLLRRAMGKKKPEEMRQQREIFVKGAAQNNISEQKANEIFDLIDKFSGYGFNKSHAAAYSYLSYQSGYLKYYYPNQFYTAVLNSHISPTLDTDKVSISFQDAKNNNIKLLPPNVNSSNPYFSIQDGGIRYGLVGLKGVGDKAAHAIQLERDKNGPYIDFYDFLERVGRGHVNKRVIEALIKSGALDDLHNNRAELLDNIEEGLNYVSKLRKKQMENTSVLGDAFDDDEAPVVKVTKKKKESKELVRPDFVYGATQDELTELKSEKTAFGYFFSANPYQTHYMKELGGFSSSVPLVNLKDIYDNDGKSEAFVGGLIEDIKWWKSKKGAFVTITDGTSSVDVRMFENFLNENKDWLKKDAFVSARIKIEGSDEENLLLSVQQGFSFDKTKELTVNKLFVGANNEIDSVSEFESICRAHKPVNGARVVDIALYGDNTNGKKSLLLKDTKVSYSEKLIEDLESVFSKQWVRPTFIKDIDHIDFPQLISRNKNKGNYKKNFSFSA